MRTNYRTQRVDITRQMKAAKYLSMLVLMLMTIAGVQKSVAQSITLTSQETFWLDANKCWPQGPQGAWLSFVVTNNIAAC